MKKQVLKSSFNISEQEMNESINIHNENSLECIKWFMEEVNDLINSKSVENAIFKSSENEAKQRS